MKKSTKETPQYGESGALGAGAHRAWSALLRCHAQCVERIERKLSAQGALSPQSYDVLLMLSYAPNHRLRMGELYEAVTLSRSGLTRLIDRLEKEGWVKREVCPNDRRSFEAILTDAGEAERERSWPLYADAITGEFGHFFGEKKAGALADLLERPLKSEGESSAPPQKMKE